MHLTENENRLQDYLDGQLPPKDVQGVEAHLAQCPQCQAVVQQWQELDRELARALSRPRLSPSFHQRLRQRIEGSFQTSASGEQDKERLQKDDQATWGALQKNFLREQLPTLLDGLGYSTAAAVGAYLLFHLILGVFHSHFSSLNLSPGQLSLGISLAAGLFFLLVGFGVAARKQLARWVEELSA